MTRIEDMSETERQSWMTLIVDVFVFFWFLQRMTYGAGISSHLESHSPSELWTIFLGVIVVTIILHAVIASVFAARKRKEDTEAKDERDVDIERKGAACGFGFLAVMINIVIGQYLIELAIEGYEFWLSLQNPAHMFLVLMSVAFIGDIIKNGTMVLAYRGE